MTCEVSYQYDFILFPMLRCSVGIIQFKTAAWECGSTAETLESLSGHIPTDEPSCCPFPDIYHFCCGCDNPQICYWCDQMTPVSLLIPLADRVTYLCPSFSLGLVLPIYLQEHSSVLQYGINKHCACTCKSVQCSKTHGLNCLQFYIKPNGAFGENTYKNLCILK